MITDTYDIITTETLKTKDMVENSNTKTLRKNILDASFFEIIRQLEYKSQLKGKHFYQVETYYPSSQICNMCGARHREYKDINKREYECPECGVKIDRDLNASINIMYRGINKYVEENLV